jgi:hypothetical protein
MQRISHPAGLPLLADADVVVIGAGSAGCAAALAAREGGRHTVLLVERYGFLGGISTQSLDTFYGFFTPGESPKKVAGGIPDRVVDRLASTNDMFLRPNTYGAGTGVSYNPEKLKIVWESLMAEAGVRVLLHCLLLDLSASAGGLDTIILHTPGGLGRVTARRFIDATGDAELCSLAGLPTEKAGDREPAQTMTTTFRMCGVDLDAFTSAGGAAMLRECMAAAVDSGEFPLPRRKGSLHAMVQPGCVSTVAVRVAGIDPFDAESLTRGEREGRRQAFLYEDFLRARVPGFQAARIISLSSPTMGIRESRRVYGEERLTEEDCLSARMPDDRVLVCGAPIEDHRDSGGEDETIWKYIPGGGAYGVPYGTLVPRGQDTLWVAGRCFSATHSAHASCRSMAQTMSMGQAAGAAAALSLEADAGARLVEVGVLQERLRRLGAVLDTPGETARTGPREWALNRRGDA